MRSSFPGQAKYPIRAGQLVLSTPIFGRVGNVIDFNKVAIVTEVNSQNGLITLCNGTEIYDDADVAEDSLDAWGCNQKLKLYGLDSEGKLQHASGKEFVEFNRLTLETSKLKDGSYKSVNDIMNHIFAKRRCDARMWTSTAQKNSDRKKIFMIQILTFFLN